jgi:hypothetical protein
VVAQNSSLVTFKTKYTATNKKNFDRHKYRKVSKLTFPTKEEQNKYFISYLFIYLFGILANKFIRFEQKIYFYLFFYKAASYYKLNFKNSSDSSLIVHS